MQHSSRSDLVRADQSALDQEAFQNFYPDFIVGECGVVRQRLASTAGHIEVPCTGRSHGNRQRQRLPLPGGMEQLIFALGDHSAETVLAAEVCAGLIDHRTPSGGFGTPVPIIESRVTRAASCSSL